MLKNILNSYLIFYSPRRFAKLIAYMLQASEYDLKAYLKWFWSTQDFSKVQVRKDLNLTRIARINKTFLALICEIQILVGLGLMILYFTGHLMAGWGYGLGLIIIYPVLWSQLIVVPIFFARLLIIYPKQKRAINRSAQIFKNFNGLKIAIVGSYGKTSMKELLDAVLRTKFKVASTAGNQNVATSHAVFANKLQGNEEILIIEFGEGQPGDVAKFSKTVLPDRAIITGLSPAHLDKYKTLNKAAEDIFSVDHYVKHNKILVNAESSYIKPYCKKAYQLYDRSGTLGWKVGAVQVLNNGLKFELSKKQQTLKIKSNLLGRHQIGPISAVIALALELGLEPEPILGALKTFKPYQHRMEPYQLNGAYIIDDTYNGNIEGIKAGCDLLRELKANRKIYITPGLVDQGPENEAVHLRIGSYIADAQPDIVILMQNSVTNFIQKGLEKAHFKGKVEIIDDPLFFYNNLKEIVAKGDLVLMQNDWPDNYR
jgi:UDP-N-acetylmuramoyl-tripeptide--D-alanyl-D-alanine ligase